MSAGSMIAEDTENKSEYPDSDIEEKEEKVEYSSLQKNSDNSTRQKDCSDRPCSFLQKYRTYFSMLLLAIILLGIFFMITISAIILPILVSKLNDHVKSIQILEQEYYKEVKELTKKVQYLELQCNRTATLLPLSDNNSELFDLQMQLHEVVSTQKDIQHELKFLANQTVVLKEQAQLNLSSLEEEFGEQILNLSGQIDHLLFHLTQYQELDDKVVRLSSRLNNTFAQLTHVEGQVNNLNSGQNSLASQILSLYSNVSTLTTQFSTFRQDLSNNFDRRFGELERHIDSQFENYNRTLSSQLNGVVD